MSKTTPLENICIYFNWKISMMKKDPTRLMCIPVDDPQTLHKNRVQQIKQSFPMLLSFILHIHKKCFTYWKFMLMIQPFDSSEI